MILVMIRRVTQTYRPQEAGISSNFTKRVMSESDSSSDSSSSSSDFNTQANEVYSKVLEITDEI